MSALTPNPYESPLTAPTLAPETPRPIWDEIEVEYDLTIEDYVAFNIHHMQRSPAHRRQQVIVILILLLVAEITNGLLLYSQALRGPLPSDAIFFHGAIAVTFLLVFGGLAFRGSRGVSNTWILKRMVRSMLTQGDPSLMLGRRRLRVTSESIDEFSDLRESKLKLQCVQRIDVAPSYAFIYIAPIMAYILPVRAFASPDHFATFVANLEGHTGKIAERLKA